MENFLIALASRDWRERDAAAEALAALGEGAVETLLAGIAHDDEQVRAQCAALMDHLADERCIDPLARALTDPSPTVRRHAVHSLGCQRCKVAPLQTDTIGLLVERALHDTSPRVRQVAVHQLGLQERDPRAVDALRQILANDTDEKLLSRARFALGNQEKAAA
jgi:HEAT repeat protein